MLCLGQTMTDFRQLLNLAHFLLPQAKLKQENDLPCGLIALKVDSMLVRWKLEAEGTSPAPPHLGESGYMQSHKTKSGINLQIYTNYISCVSLTLALL